MIFSRKLVTIRWVKRKISVRGTIWPLDTIQNDRSIRIPQEATIRATLPTKTIIFPGALIDSERWELMEQDDSWRFLGKEQPTDPAERDIGQL